MSQAMQRLRAEITAAGPEYWLRDARVPPALLAAPSPGVLDGQGLARLDLQVSHGKIAAIAPLGTAPAGPSLDGGQLWPGPIDGHTHMDKGQIWGRTPNATGDFFGAFTGCTADRETWTDTDIEARFEFSLRAAYAHGTVAIRTHLESFAPRDPASWRVFRKLRDRWAGRITLQASSICPMDRLQGEDGTLLADIVADSGGVLGMVTRLTGGVHDDLPPEFQPMLDHVFSLAEARGLELDIHVDESGESGARALIEVARTAIKRGFKKPIQVGHCCSLSIQPEEFARETIRLCAEAGLNFIVLPMCNMYLQDRTAGRTPRWRGVTLVHELRAAGCRVSVASDNTRDPFYAYGDMDMVEVYREATRILQLDHPVGDWPKAYSVNPAAALGLTGQGSIAVGATADLLLFRSRGWTEWLSRPHADRIVLRAGQVLTAEVPDYRELDATIGGPG